MKNRRNRNRGYQQLVVWQDAVEYFGITCEPFKSGSFEFGKIRAQQLASVDSVHRNIAEGYCRRSIREYLQHLNIALGSLGESVSAQFAYLRSNHLTQECFEILDGLSYKLENGLLRLVEALERKRDEGSWTETLIVEESNAVYGNREDRE
ncbi:MAG: four helix bundle protein [Opitutales bacterium]|nr:four helix bundle protein [Opitutales bacterium]